MIIVTTVAKIDFNVSDGLGSIVRMIDRLVPAWQADGMSTLDIDLVGSRYLGPNAVALLAATIFDARRKGSTVRVVLPEGPPQLVLFCEQSGLRHLIDGSVFVESTEQPSVTVPLRQHHRASHNDAEPVLRLLTATVGSVSEEFEFAIGIAFSELLQNVDDHAASPIGAISCARYMPSRREVRIAIVDFGRGIHTTLRERFPNIQDAKTAVQAVLAGGTSAQSRKSNMGQGINNLRLAVAHLHGELTIISEAIAVHARNGGVAAYYPMAVRFPGTAIFYSIPVDQRTPQ